MLNHCVLWQEIGINDRNKIFNGQKDYVDETVLFYKYEIGNNKDVN